MSANILVQTSAAVNKICSYQRVTGLFNLGKVLWFQMNRDKSNRRMPGAEHFIEQHTEKKKDGNILEARTDSSPQP